MRANALGGNPVEDSRPVSAYVATNLPSERLLADAQNSRCFGRSHAARPGALARRRDPLRAPGLHLIRVHGLERDDALGRSNEVGEDYFDGIAHEVNSSGHRREWPQADAARSRTYAARKILPVTVALVASCATMSAMSSYVEANYRSASYARKVAEVMVEHEGAELLGPLREAALRVAAAGVRVAEVGSEARARSFADAAWPLQARRRALVDLVGLAAKCKRPSEELQGAALLLGTGFQAVAAGDFSRAAAEPNPRQGAAVLGLGGFGAASAIGNERALIDSAMAKLKCDERLQVRLHLVQRFLLNMPATPSALNCAIGAASAITAGLSGDQYRLEVAYDAVLPMTERRALALAEVRDVLATIEPAKQVAEIRLRLVACDPAFEPLTLGRVEAKVKKLARLPRGQGNFGAAWLVAELGLDMGALGFCAREAEPRALAVKRIAQQLRSARS